MNKNYKKFQAMTSPKKIFFLVLFVCAFPTISFAGIGSEDAQTLHAYEDHLMLSTHVYSLSGKLPEDVKGNRVNEDYNFWSQGKDWVIVDYKDNSLTGFTAAIYKNAVLNKYMLVFAGTTGGEHYRLLDEDWYQNFKLLNSAAPADQFAEAEIVADTYLTIAN
jgi:hypothetical protein